MCVYVYGVLFTSAVTSGEKKKVSGFAWLDDRWLMWQGWRRERL